MTDSNKRMEIRHQHKDSWIAVEEGDVLVGTVQDVTEAWSDQRQNGSWYPLLTIGKIEQATGYEPGWDGEGTTTPIEFKVHAFGAVLYNEVMRHQPEVGERVQITYRGTGETKKRGQNPPELYSLRVAGRKDQAQRAYARISGGEQPRPGSDSPVTTEDFATTPNGGADEDIPF
jgi:hypothetical protein